MSTTKETAGRDDRLGLVMTSNRHSVRCSTPLVEAPDNCDNILRSMVTTRDRQRFGHAGGGLVEVILPYELANGECSSWRLASALSFQSMSSGSNVCFSRLPGFKHRMCG